jgi:AbrB family looped-hinge helix DNA binding protein
MKYETTITSKGTITIAAPLRKALGLKPGQKVNLSLNKENKVVIDPGTTLKEFEALRNEVLSKLPKRKKPLTGRALKDAIANAWVEQHR